MKKILYLIFLLPLFTQAQTDCNNPSGNRGKVIIHADDGLNAMIYSRKQLNEKETDFQGYRVQVYQGKDRNEAQKIKFKIAEKFPNTEVYLIYQQPYFRVRVGDYRNKTEALKPLHELKQDFEGAFIAPDRIKYPKL
ncbi:MAG: SPOR domain-containing protein [Bacteroidetes bacterium]|nr:SPOR domain-containing protein [Bacteroidota bacterium]